MHGERKEKKGGGEDTKKKELPPAAFVVSIFLTDIHCETFKVICHLVSHKPYSNIGNGLFKLFESIKPSLSSHCKNKLN